MRQRNRRECDLPAALAEPVQPREQCCFVYARVSTNDQADTGTSLEAQEEQGRRFCKDQGYPDPQVRIEVESAGEEKIERRIEMRRILNEIQPGDVLVCRDLTRWSRDQVFALQSLRQLKSNGVTVRFWTQPFLDVVPGAGAAPVDLTGILAWAAENERRMTLERTITNRRRLRARGDFVEGLPPFGYTVQNRRLVIVPERAAIVQRIFNDYLNGHPMRDICDRLRAEHSALVSGFRKPRIMRWSWNFVQRALRNRLYTGYSPTTRKKGRDPLLPSQSEWLKTHEAIIPPHLFEQVTEIFERQRQSYRPHDGPSITRHYLLKHVAVCSVCGYAIRPSHDKRLKEELRDRYQCGKRHEPRRFADRTRCTNGSTTLQRKVDADAEAQILARLDELVDVLSKHAKPAKPTPPNWGKLASALSDKRACVVRLVVKGVITEEDAAKQLNELQREEAALETRREAFERAQLADTEGARKEAFSKLKSYRGLYENLSISDRRELFFELAESVKITPAGDVLITWRPVPQISNNLETTKAGASR